MNKPVNTLERADVIQQSVIGCCLEPLLDALKWRGTKRQLREALPHYNIIHSVPSFLNVLERLNYKSDAFKTSLKKMDSRLLPCLFVTEKNKIYLILEKKEDRFIVFNAEMNNKTEINDEELKKMDIKGTCYTFKFVSKKEYVESQKVHWLRKLFLQNRQLIYIALVLSFALSLLMLAIPLFIMSVYDRVIGADSYVMLEEFLIAIFIAVAGYIALHKIRSRTLALLGSRLDKAIGNTIFERIIYLAPIYTETASVGSQVARIKDFDKLREFLSGPLLSVVFEIPFIILAMIVIAMIGGILVLIPIILIFSFIVLGLIFSPETKRKTQAVSEKNAEQQEFIIETIRKLRALKYLGAENKWSERFRDISAETCYANIRTTVLGATFNALSDLLMILSGLAVICFGAMKVIHGTLSIGGMIAIMILTWRTLSPLKALFITFPKVTQIFKSLQQINSLMRIEPESEARETLYLDQRQLEGDIRFNRVSFRYQTSLDAVLLGVNFNVKPGSLVGVMGRNGSGKSTLLKLILRLYQPQAGSILINNQDIRQFNPIDLRNHIAYLPQSPELFYGTIAQNLRLAEPGATLDDLKEAAENAGVLENILQLPKGFDTPMREFSTMRITGSFRQGLCLARAYLKKASILLLDEPGNVLDETAEKKLIEKLNEIRGKVTTFVVTHRPSHIQMMDEVLLLDRGQLLIQGKPSDVLPKIPKELL